MDQSNSQDSKPENKKPEQVQMNKVAEHTLTDGELAVFAEIYAGYERSRLAIAKYMCQKHGYPEEDPVAFQFDWKGKKVMVYRPQETKLETATEMPNAPTPPTPGKTT